MSSAGSSLPFARGVMKAYEDAFKPPASAAKAAARGLEMREKQPPSKRGGTAVGVSRARDLKARKALSKDTIKRMVSFFARHRDPESSSSKTRGEGPSEAKQADLLWGGSAGKRWANSVKRKLEAQGKYSDEEQATPAPPEDRIEGSDKNPRGSAKKAGGIDLGSRTEAALRGKARNHNMRMREPWQKTTKGALEAVWRRGAGAYSTSHRPGVSRAAWAMARVNAFLYLLRTGKPKDPKYKSDNDLLPRDHPRKTGRGAGGRYVESTSSLYADEDGGRWITIGAQSVEGPDGKTKKEGGTPVFIKRSGEITKGPKGLMGRNVSNLGKDKDKAPKGKKGEKPGKLSRDDKDLSWFLAYDGTGEKGVRRLFGGDKDKAEAALADAEAKGLIKRDGDRFQITAKGSKAALEAAESESDPRDRLRAKRKGHLKDFASKSLDKFKSEFDKESIDADPSNLEMPVLEAMARLNDAKDALDALSGEDVDKKKGFAQDTLREAAIGIAENIKHGIGGKNEFGEGVMPLSSSETQIQSVEDLIYETKKARREKEAEGKIIAERKKVSDAMVAKLESATKGFEDSSYVKSAIDEAKSAIDSMSSESPYGGGVIDEDAFKRAKSFAEEKIESARRRVEGEKEYRRQEKEKVQRVKGLIDKSKGMGRRPKLPESVTIRGDFDGEKEKKVKPKGISRSGDLVVTGGKGNWTVTHTRSGFAIGAFGSKKKAMNAMDAADALTSWKWDDFGDRDKSKDADVRSILTVVDSGKYADSFIHYADDTKGRWITIGARSKKGGDSDGPSGGARVFIKDGKVAKGPGAVKGKSLSQIDEGKPKRGMAPAAKAKIGGAKEPKGRKSKVEFAKTIRDFDAMSRKERYGKIGQLDDELSKMKKGGASQEEIATAKDRLEQLKTKNRELMEAEEKDLMVDQRGIVSSGPSWLIGGRIEAPGDDATSKVREARKEGVLDAGGGYQISNDTGTIVKVPKGMKALRGAKLVGREGRKIHERVQDNAQRVESAKDKRRDADQAKRREAMAARKKKIEGIRKSIGLDKREPKGEEVKKGRLVEVKKGRLLSEAERFGRAMRQRKAKRRKARAGGGKWVAERQAKRGKRGILSRLGFADEAVIYADDENGRWVTIGAQEVDGKKKGGTPVFISKGGKITKGPKGLTGRNISNLKEPPKEEFPSTESDEGSSKTAATNDVSKMAEMLENTGLAESHGLIMRSWEKGGKKRIYIKRQLSKRVQDVGFIDVDERDNVTYESQRINSVIRTLASWAREIIDGEFSDDLTHYAESEGRWITIGAVEEEDAATGKTSRKGGTPVFIRNGKITKGPKSLKGKSLGKLDKDVQPKKAKANRQKAFEEAFKKIKAESEARAGKPAEKAPEPKAEAPKAEMKVRPGGKTVKGKYGPAIIKDVGGFDVNVEVNNPDGSRRSKEERDAEALRRGIEKKKRFEAKMKREMGTRTPKAKTPTPEPEKPKAEAPKAEAPKKKLTGAELDRFIRERSDVGKKHSDRRFRRALPSDAERGKAQAGGEFDSDPRVQEMRSEIETIESKIRDLTSSVMDRDKDDIFRSFDKGRVGFNKKGLAKKRTAALGKTIDKAVEVTKLRGKVDELKSRIKFITSGKDAARRARIDAKKPKGKRKVNPIKKASLDAWNTVIKQGRNPTLSDGSVVSYEPKETPEGISHDLVLTKPDGSKTKVDPGDSYNTRRDALRSLVESHLRSIDGEKSADPKAKSAKPSDQKKGKAKPKKAKKERRPFEDAEDMRAVNKRLDMIAQGVKRKRAREAARRAGRKTFAAEVLRMYQEAFA